MKKYDFIVSIGTACFTSSVLRKCFLQFKSYPFDWIGTKSITGIFKFITGEFKDFFNKEDLVSLDAENGKNKHSCYMYKNAKYDIVLPHDIVAEKSFDEAYEIAVQKYNRRIARFYNSIRNSKTTLFVHIDLPNVKSKQISDDELKDSFREVCEYFKDNRIELLCIKYNKNYTIKKPKDYYISDNIRVVEFDYLKYSSKYKFDVGDEFKMCKFLIKNVSLNLTFFQKIKFILNSLIIKLKKF